MHRNSNLDALLVSYIGGLCVRAREQELASEPAER